MRPEGKRTHVAETFGAPSEGKSALKVGATSHVGLVRRDNEDAYCSIELFSGDAARLYLAGVADGMGGGVLGGVASRLALDTAAKSLTALSSGIPGLPKDEYISALHGAVVAANLAVCRFARERLHGSPMGTTLTLALIYWDERKRRGDLFCAHVGDSRIYLVHGPGRRRPELAGDGHEPVGTAPVAVSARARRKKRYTLSSGLLRSGALSRSASGATRVRGRLLRRVHADQAGGGLQDETEASPSAPKVEQVTLDHSVVGELLRLGEIDEREAMTHPRRNLLTQAVGTSDGIAVDLQQRRLFPGDAVVLCTDGLTSLVEREEIGRLVAAAKEPQHAALQLAELANARGGFDNVTVVVIFL